VKLARAWVAEVLREIGRADLVNSAELGVSELVTNAILHAKPPMTVSIRGTVDHPRIEVTDHSPGPIEPPTLAAVDDLDFPTTFGRGLAMVAMNAAQWGSEADPDGFGKRVWFEPATEMSDDPDLSASFHGPRNDQLDEPVVPPEDCLSIVLLDVPAMLFGHLRRYHFELRRELRLLALADRSRYPIAVAITETFDRADAERRASSGVNRLDDAIARGMRRVSLEYAVPSTAPATMGRIQELLEECYRFFADDHLLSMAPPQELRELQAWYLGQFVSQGHGSRPVAWDGPTELAPASTSVG
jgi:anti-sigma regulatory factor (Ser/Thr protein kinase)